MRHTFEIQVATALAGHLAVALDLAPLAFVTGGSQHGAEDET